MSDEQDLVAFHKLTLDHIQEVRKNLNFFVDDILLRGKVHDRSKLAEPELSLLATATENLKKFEFGSPEYEAEQQRQLPALQHHYAHNSHHPEHYPNGVNGMDLCDIVEMLADIQAAWERSGRNQPFRDSVDAAFHRFNIDGQLRDIILNTFERKGWL